MARPYRLQAEDTLYHIIVRGNERKNIFRRARDYEKYLEYLACAKEKYQCHIYAYVLMNNHLHLLLETSLPNISQIMHYLNSSYSTYFNVKYKRVGHLFQGRYKSVIVDKEEYLLELTRYIHLNPVRAKMVKKPGDYTWSSYQAFIGKRNDDLISLKHLKHYNKFTKEQYRQFVESLSVNEHKLREDMYAGFILGSERFIKAILKECREQVETKDVSFASDINDAIRMDEILTYVCSYYKVDQESICKARRLRSDARAASIYFVKQYTSCSNGEIGERFGISYSAVSKMVATVNKRIKEERGYRKEIKELNSQLKG